MPQLPFLQIGLLGLQAALIALLLLGLFRLRTATGLSPLYITVGGMQQLQVLLAVTVYVEIVPNLLISPGSAVLFPASLFVILLVYLRHDASEARRLVYGLVLANLSIGLLSWLAARHIGDPAVVNVFDLPASFFAQSLRVLAAGTGTLFLDVVLLIHAYEFFARWSVRWLFPHLFLTLATVLTFDSLTFITAAFAGHPDYASLLVSSLIGKIAMAVPYSAVLAAFLRYQDPSSDTVSILTSWVRKLDVFRPLSFRQRYEEARAEATRDQLTGLHNRRFLTEMLPLALERARRSDEGLSVLVIDIDRFKQINDRYGHPAGDTVLRHIAGVLQSTARAQDAVCRFGGDELVVVMPGGSESDADSLRDRIQSVLAATPAPVLDSALPQPTLTIGSASFPVDGTTADALLQRADERLYSIRGRRRD